MLQGTLGTTAFRLLSAGMQTSQRILDKQGKERRFCLVLGKLGTQAFQQGQASQPQPPGKFLSNGRRGYETGRRQERMTLPGNLKWTIDRGKVLCPDRIQKSIRHGPRGLQNRVLLRGGRGCDIQRLVLFQAGPHASP